jgi:hypothetical protein
MKTDLITIIVTSYTSSDATSIACAGGLRLT